MYKSDEKYFGVINDTNEQLKILLKDNDISVLLPPEDILNGIVNNPSKEKTNDKDKINNEKRTNRIRKMEKYD